jgi:hypothetical protein
MRNWTPNCPIGERLIKAMMPAMVGPIRSPYSKTEVLLTDAVQKGHANRMFGFFRSYLQSGGALDSSYEVALRARDRARQFVSGRRTYSRAEISRLYEQHRQGLFGAQQWARLESDIIAAAREGRVIDPVTDIAGK